MACSKGWGTSLTARSFDTPGPKPGNPRAISQRKAIAEGYAAAKSERCVDTYQKATKTGGVSVPGFTDRGRK
jgi:hypothetical protein